MLVFQVCWFSAWGCPLGHILWGIILWGIIPWGISPQAGACRLVQIACICCAIVCAHVFVDVRFIVFLQLVDCLCTYVCGCPVADVRPEVSGQRCLSRDVRMEMSVLTIKIQRPQGSAKFVSVSRPFQEPLQPTTLPVCMIVGTAVSSGCVHASVDGKTAWCNGRELAGAECAMLRWRVFIVLPSCLSKTMSGCCGTQLA